MDGARLSRFPHQSWFVFPVAGTPTGSPCVVTMSSLCHVISRTAAGSHEVRCIARGRETRWSEMPKTLHMLPADGEERTFVAHLPPDLEKTALFIPRAHIGLVAESEQVRAPHQLRRLVLADDAILGACVTALGAAVDGDDGRLDGRNDELARRLLLRLYELNGMAPPDWRDDASTFPRRTLEFLTAYVDEHLKVAPALHEMAVLVGLSPSHFAKKFRQSTGLSLHRFVNRRRLRRSFDVLKHSAAPLAGVALELGFSSQSHFTRLFSDLTGMTPARYRGLCRRTVG